MALADAPKIAIVGRPNVGKSTLFNRLAGRRLALVHDAPGVTRDRRESAGQLYDLDFTLMDTAGFEEAARESLAGRMRAQTEGAVAEADLVLFLIDARAGVTPLDEAFARILRKAGKPVVLAANKCEGAAAEAGLAEAYGLGLGAPVALSAEHGLGLADLHEAMKEFLQKLGFKVSAQPADRRKGRARSGREPETGLPPGAAPGSAEEAAGAQSHLPAPCGASEILQLAIVGRPNVGKSTLINRLVGAERLLTGPEAGITRDSIAVDWAYKGRAVKLFDTAGLRRRAKVAGSLEKLTAVDTKRSIDFAQVVVLLLDAQQPMEKQDLTIARQVVDEGRALVIGLNKWDACEDKAGTLAALKDRLARSLPQTLGIPVVTLSGLKGRNLDRLMAAVFDIYEAWCRRIPTAALNRWLADMTDAHPPPMAKGRRLRLKYMTQAKTRPPTFAIFTTRPAELPASYLRYLEKALRQDFDLPGVPIRINLRKRKNPYEG